MRKREEGKNGLQGERLEKGTGTPLEGMKIRKVCPGAEDAEMDRPGPTKMGSLH